jgi:hypothetical protein
MVAWCIGELSVLLRLQILGSRVFGKIIVDEVFDLHMQLLELHHLSKFHDLGFHVALSWVYWFAA